MSERKESTPITRHEDVAQLIGAVEVTAPQRVHRRVREMVAPSARSPRQEIRARLRPTLIAMAAAALAGVAIALLSGGTGGTTFDLHDASALTLRSATSGAPQELGSHSDELNVSTEGVSFPYWEERFGWRSTGARTDTLAGHRVTTVFYGGPHGSRVGYAIASGAPPASLISSLRSGRLVRRDGVPYWLTSAHGAPVVVWKRDGKLCVLSGRSVDGGTLLRLASWDEERAA